MELDLVL